MVDYEDIEEFELLAQDLADEISDIETYGAFTGMYRIIKKALRYMKGLNCTVKEVLQIETAAQTFVDSVQACGGEVSKKVQNLIDACNDIIQTCKDILGINESICGNTVDDDDADDDDDDVETYGVVSTGKTVHKCFVKMVRKVNKLKKQVKKAIKMINDIKKVPGDTNDCVLTAVNSLEMTFTQFPANVKTCSKLTS